MEEAILKTPALNNGIDPIIEDNIEEKKVLKTPKLGDQKKTYTSVYAPLGLTIVVEAVNVEEATKLINLEIEKLNK